MEKSKRKIVLSFGRLGISNAITGYCYPLQVFSFFEGRLSSLKLLHPFVIRFLNCINSHQINTTTKINDDSLRKTDSDDVAGVAAAVGGTAAAVNDNDVPL